MSEQNIYKINFLYDENDKVRRVKKGYRNKMLFTWGITIRNIQPNIEIEELFKNIYWLYSFRCEKSEDFTVHQACNIALNIFKTDINAFNQLGKRKYLIASNYKELSRADKAKALGQARRKTRDENILPNYDFCKSVKENAKELGVSENTVRNCLRDNGILTPKQNKFECFKEVYTKHPNATIAQLAEWIGASIKSIVTYKKKLKEQLVENL